MLTAQDVLDNFGATYKGASSADQAALLNDTDIMLARAFPMRKKTLYLALTQGISEYYLDSRAVWIEQARYIDAPNASGNGGLGGWPLIETNVDEMDTSGYDYRANSNSTPQYAMISSDRYQGLIKLDSPAPASSLLLQDATNASPIVAKTIGNPALTDGTLIEIFGVIGNPAANALCYVKATGYPIVLGNQTFGLYSDSALTTPIAGNGAYQSGGIVSTSGYPVLQAFVRWHEALVAGLVIHAASAATPIVFTTSSAHGLDDGARVRIAGATGDTNVNGDWYVNVLTATMGALYADSLFLTPSSTGGTYTADSGTLNSLLPDVPQLRRFWSNQMKYLYASDRVMSDVRNYQALNSEVEGREAALMQQRGGRKPIKLRTLTERTGGYAVRVDPGCGCSNVCQDSCDDLC